jgi:hypothetical protein
MIVLIRWLARLRRILESRSTYLRLALLLRLFAGIVFLHLAQVGVWAVVFWRAQELPNVLVGWSTAFVFAVVNRMSEHSRQEHGGS